MFSVIRERGSVSQQINNCSSQSTKTVSVLCNLKFFCTKKEPHKAVSSAEQLFPSLTFQLNFPTFRHRATILSKLKAFVRLRPETFHFYSFSRFARNR